MSTSTTQLPTPAGWSRWTGKARLVVERHATDVAAELGHERVGTEHLLAGFWGEPGNVALQVLEASGLTRAAVVEGIETNAPRGSGTAPAWTRESLATLDHVCTGIGIGLGHNYVATEHLLLFIICDQGSVAESILAAQGLSEVSVRRDVLAALADRSKK